MKNWLKLAFGIALAGIFAGSCFAAGFNSSSMYTNGMFSDVSEKDWFATEVSGAYNLGLMNGIDTEHFEPHGTVTLAQAITVAARAHAAYYGEEIPHVTDSPETWYTPYVEYAKKYGFGTEFESYTRNATREEVAGIFADALPKEWYGAKNSISYIPDVDNNSGYCDKILMLYNAGIVMGSDAYGTFRPYDTVTRAEVAAIINRAAVPENRIKKELLSVNSGDVYVSVSNSGFSNSKEGIASGWVLDNRGGVPRTELTDPYGALFDVRTDAGCAYIRGLNNITEGRIQLITKLSVSGDGVYLEYQNPDGKTVYRLETKEGSWQVHCPDGTYKKLCAYSQNTSGLFAISVDLDNNISETVIDGNNFGINELCTDKSESSLDNFRFATTKESTSAINPASVLIYSNYSVYENFSFVGKDNFSTSWESEGASALKSELHLAKYGYARKAFDAVTGKAAAEFEIISGENQNASFSVLSGGKKLVTVSSDGKGFLFCDKSVYQDFYPGQWYRFRIELDTRTQKALLKINGRKLAECDFYFKTSFFDGISIENLSQNELVADTINFFKLVEHDDYVPVPKVPAGEEEYTVGMNVCSLWSNGTHYGWSCISAYDDCEPVLGYYDEGIPETADWEIKYMVEHGIDFGAYCVYFNSPNSVIKLEADHLFNGYMNAKYSDMSKYCIIWEAHNGSSPNSVENFVKYYVPYLVENFLKDARYMTIDNKPVLCVFGTERMAERAGGVGNVNEMFGILEQEAKKLGYDGMIYLACGSSNKTLADMGFDGSYAYNWGADGYKTEVNIEKNLSSAKDASVYAVPTISVGFNAIPWHGTRYPMMTKDDYKASNDWVKNTYLPGHAFQSWQKNFVMFSTWNEYGEGTYIMPTSDDRGFGYLDVLREEYTGEKADSSLNTVPTEEQKKRINHRYPQNLHLLRKQGYGSDENISAELESIAKLDFSALGTAWGLESGFKKENGEIRGKSVSKDPIFIIEHYTGDINLDGITKVNVIVSSPKGSTVQLYFITDTDSEWNSKKMIATVKQNDGEETVIFDVTKNSLWKGKLKGIRIDPCADENVEVAIKTAELFGSNSVGLFSKTININGKDKDMSFLPEQVENGDVLVAFEPAIGMDFSLALFHTWDKNTGTLSLYSKDHSLVFTVGSDEYRFDGNEKMLSYKIKTVDGLLLIPINILCSELDYGYEVRDGKICVTTYESEFFASLSHEKTDGTWEFEGAGDNEGWKSSSMSLMTNGGYISCVSQTSGTDPNLVRENEVKLLAEKYDKLELRVRYEYSAENPSIIKMYFLTSKDGAWSESKTLTAKLHGTSSGGEWETYTIDTSANDKWKDIITNLRFDPFAASGSMDIDYIRFKVNPSWTEPDPSEMYKFSLDNTDAEGTGGFTSRNAAVSIVTDPQNSNNRCYLIFPKSDTKTWLYADHPTYFKPGATYKVQADVKLASYGTALSSTEEITTNVLCNVQYTDPAAESVNHLVSDMKIKNSDGWQHWSFEFTVSSAAKADELGKFSIYSNPFGDMAIGFYFDNVFVTEVSK